MTDAFLPYGRQEITDGDVAAVAEALRRPLITQGELVDEFEAQLAARTGAAHAVVFSSGTAALHAAAAAAGLGAADTVPTTPLSFAASSNCLLFVGARPRFCDISWDTCNLDVAAADASGVFDQARATVVVSLAGLPADLSELQRHRREHGLIVIEDACHALGGVRAGRPVGGDQQADMYCFSLHPVKSITTGEGGAVTTESAELARRLRAFRTHGIVRAAESGGPLKGPWHYDVASLGFNYRITDFQCALGLSQLERLDEFIGERNRVADDFRELLADVEGLVLPPAAAAGDTHAYHLFVVRMTDGPEKRLAVAESLRGAGIGTQLHYIPIYRHSLYTELGYGGADIGRCANTERYYETALSLPMYPGMTRPAVERVSRELGRLMSA